MANASGGVIIYGIAESKSKTIRIDPITDQDKEYLDQVIASQTTPKSTWIIHAIPVDGGFVYVVNVEQGETAHQCKADCKYHKRENFTTRCMEDYEIRDMMGRSKNPKVGVRFTRKHRRLCPVLFNEGLVMTKDVRCKLLMPEYFISDSWSGSDELTELSIVSGISISIKYYILMLKLKVETIMLNKDLALSVDRWPKNKGNIDIPEGLG